MYFRKNTGGDDDGGDDDRNSGSGHNGAVIIDILIGVYCRISANVEIVLEIYYYVSCDLILYMWPDFEKPTELSHGVFQF